jgi:signal transduction histidine kinase
MSTHSSLVLSVSLVAGVALLAVGGDIWRRWERPGASALSVSLVVLGAMPILSLMSAIPGFSVIGSAIFIVCWCLATAAWFLFSLAYTGTYTRQSTGLVVALVAPSVLLIPWSLELNASGGGGAIEALSVVILSTYSGLALIGSLLVVRSTVRYGHIPLRQGSALTIVGLVPSLTVTLFGQSVEGEVTLGPALIYTGGFALTAIAAGLAVYRYDLFSPVPTAGAIGERAMLRETDDIVAIVDMEGRLLSLNERGHTTATHTESPTLGTDIERVLGYSVSGFADRETVELDTDEGVRQFDSQVSRLTDAHGGELGAIVSLRDVTERELRKQRLEVLNRILGHNIRNEVSVITANAEFVADHLDDDLAARLDSTIDSAASLEAIGTKARRIENLLGRERDDTVAFDLGEFLDTVVEETTEQWPSAAVTQTSVADTRLDCDRESLQFVLDNLLENAIEHGGESPQVELGATVDGDDRHPVVIKVRDDGPGIPESEVAVIESGQETDLSHGSGVGLWVTNWAVTDLGGELSFEHRDGGGTIARVALPSSALAD